MSVSLARTILGLRVSRVHEIARVRETAGSGPRVPRAQVTDILASMAVSIQRDDPLSYDVHELVNVHLDFARRETPLCHVFALSADALVTDDIELYSCRDDGELLAIGAIRALGDDHFEIKSMHTKQSVRGRGIGRLLIQHLIEVARRRGAARVSLETGTSSGFAPARSLYATLGFALCEPFSDYSPSPDNVCMTLVL